MPDFTDGVWDAVLRPDDKLRITSNTGLVVADVTRVEDARLFMQARKMHGLLTEALLLIPPKTHLSTEARRVLDAAAGRSE